MRIRVRAKDTVHNVTLLTEGSTIDDLKLVVADLTGIIQYKQELKIGYPPRLCTAEGESTLAAAGVKDGDVIIVVEASSPVRQPSPPPALSTPSMQPVSAVPVASSSAEGTEIISVVTPNGYAILREMPDDNSCLFRAIGYVLDKSVREVSSLREIIIDQVRKNPEMYSDVILGRPRDDYCRWIAQKNSWGGAIELAIFAQHYKVEIRSIDVGTGRVDSYGQGRYNQCTYLIYSGIHYDAGAISPVRDANIRDFDQTIFEVTDEQTVAAMKDIAGTMKKLHKYTYTATFTLLCAQCSKGLVGEREATQHAAETGHTNFMEYEKL